MLSDAILETTITRLAINFSKFFKKGEKECYANLFREYFPYTMDDDWIQAIEAYIRNPDHRQMPKVADLQAVLPKRNQLERIACNACHKGLRSIAEKSQFGYWQAITYACTCEAGKAKTAFAQWQCNGCVALDPFSKQNHEETKQMLPVCRAYNFHAYDVNCSHWKKRLAEEAGERKPPNISRLPHGVPDIEEAQIPF